MDDARQRLRKDVAQKIRTTMIAALEAFEDEFGDIWGINKSDNEATPEEDQFLEKWLRARERILDKGNSQIGAMLANLDRYDIQSTRYSVKFINRRNDGRDNF